MISYTIPRGIKVRKTVAYGLNGKQIIYLAVGLGGAVGVWALALPIDLKIAGAMLSVICSLALSLAKFHKQELDKYALNSMKYQLRKKEWSEDEEKKEEAIVIRFSPRQSGAI